jgi:hypothetical protein
MSVQRLAGSVALAAAAHLIEPATKPIPPPAYDGCGSRAALAAAPKRILRSMCHLPFSRDIVLFGAVGFKDGTSIDFRITPRGAPFFISASGRPQ